MSKKIKDNIFVYGLILMILAVGIAIGTYAYYQTTINGTASGTVLAWNCDLGSSGVQKNTFANMYPGVSGEITFNVTSSITADYTITISNYKYMNTGTRAALKLYTDSAHSTVIGSGDSVTGEVATNGGTGTTTIYYYWPYGTAEEYISSKPSFDWQITCTQK